ncbi:MAG TPA: FecR domain-containing protein [Bacteriovoracaceae bacterium]|nr:FecR domain-containing protein [Bacteriovoracaceae bacterium]
MKFLIIFFQIFFISSGYAEGYKIALQRGTVEITRGGKPVTGDVISGDRVAVHKKSILILKNSKETLKIMQDTVITPLEKEDETIIKLAKGALVSLVVNRKFKVETKQAVMGVRGTQFFVQATGKDDLWMCVEEGVVNVVSKGSKNPVDVPAGKGVFISPKEISKPQAYAWTKGINWKMDPKEKKLDHVLKLNYDLLDNFYD